MRKANCFTPSIAAQKLAGVPLWQREITELGCLVTRDSETRITVIEPLTYKVPRTARPHCCYMNTVIFYVWPHIVTKDRGFLEWDAIDHVLPWDADFLHEGRIYRAGGGRVISKNGGWWMLHWAKYREAAFLNRP